MQSNLMIIIKLWVMIVESTVLINYYIAMVAMYLSLNGSTYLQLFCHSVTLKTR